MIFNQYNQQLYTGNYDMAALIELVGESSNARITSQLGPMTKRIIMGQSVMFKSEELSPLKKKSMSDAVLKHPSKDGFRIGTSLLEIIASRKVKNRGSRKKIQLE